MLSENIKKYRQAAGMNQKELAAKIHVVRQTVSKWENNLSVPDADQLILLSEVLGVSVNELLDTLEKMKIIQKRSQSDCRKRMQKSHIWRNKIAFRRKQAKSGE